MIRERHPELAEEPLVEVGRRRQHFSLGVAREAPFTLTGVMGFTPPSLDSAIKRSLASRLATGRL